MRDQNNGQKWSAVYVPAQKTIRLEYNLTHDHVSTHGAFVRNIANLQSRLQSHVNAHATVNMDFNHAQIGRYKMVEHNSPVTWWWVEAAEPGKKGEYVPAKYLGWSHWPKRADFYKKVSGVEADFQLAEAVKTLASRLHVGPDLVAELSRDRDSGKILMDEFQRAVHLEVAKTWPQDIIDLIEKPNSAIVTFVEPEAVLV